MMLAVAGAGSILLIVAVWLGGDGLETADMGGTMGGASALALGEIDAGWQGGLKGDLEGRLDDYFAIEFDVFNRSGDVREATYSLYFSRDGEFSADNDCLVGESSLQIPASNQAAVSFRTTPHLVNCLDAGPWRAAVLDEAAGTWTELDESYTIRGGQGQMTLAGLPRQAGHRAEIKLDVDVSRETGSVGAMGLWQHPVDVWLRRDEELCLVELAPVDLQRDPVRGGDGAWKTSRIQMDVALKEAVKVSSLGGYADPFEAGALLPERQDCEGCRAPELAGRCSLDEGEWDVAVGPTMSAWHKVETVYLHAPPVTIDPTRMRITLSEGEVGSIERMAYNPGQRAVTWASAASDRFANGWLVGMADQSLAGREPGPVQFTVSARDLAPGLYTGDFVFAATDFYGTEIKIPVELTVEAARKGLDPSVAQEFAVSNYPNPFNGRTTLQLEIQAEGQFKLTVFDIQGREVRFLLDEWLSVGRREVSFDAQDLPSGTYLYRLTGEGTTVSGTMSLVK
jgi:Secretion system C-terminal sorting domain